MKVYSIHPFHIVNLSPLISMLMYIPPAPWWFDLLLVLYMLCLNLTLFYFVIIVSKKEYRFYNRVNLSLLINCSYRSPYFLRSFIVNAVFSIFIFTGVGLFALNYDTNEFFLGKIRNCIYYPKTRLDIWRSHNS